jgi:hypothetical protein
MTLKWQEEGLCSHQHLSGGAEEEHEQPGYPNFLTRTETRTFRLRFSSPDYLTARFDCWYGGCIELWGFHSFPTLTDVTVVHWDLCVLLWTRNRNGHVHVCPLLQFERKEYIPGACEVREVKRVCLLLWNRGCCSEMNDDLALECVPEFALR